MNKVFTISEIFQKCSEMTDDDFWKVLFSDAAKNKLPKGFFLGQKQLTYRHGNKIHHCLIPKSPRTAYEVLMSFFRNIGCINSDKDILNNKEDEKNSLTQCEAIRSWKEIKKKKVKETLINKFISKKIKEFNMNKEEQKCFITTVYKGFLWNLFKNIEIVNGEIEDIKELIYDEENKKFTIPDIKIKTDKSKPEGNDLYYPSHDKKPISLYRLWINFIDKNKDNEMSEISSSNISY